MTTTTNRQNGIAHPEWIDDAVANLHKTLGIDMQMARLGGIPPRNFMLSTPAHRLLRAIHGGVWSVAWWALRKAARDTFNERMPLRWHEWRLRRAERADQ